MTDDETFDPDEYAEAAEMVGALFGTYRGVIDHIVRSKAMVELADPHTDERIDQMIIEDVDWARQCQPLDAFEEGAVFEIELDNWGIENIEYDEELTEHRRQRAKERVDDLSEDL